MNQNIYIENIYYCKCCCGNIYTSKTPIIKKNNEDLSLEIIEKINFLSVKIGKNFFLNFFFAFF